MAAGTERPDLQCRRPDPCFGVPPAPMTCTPVGNCAKTGLYCKDVGNPVPAAPRTTLPSPAEHLHGQRRQHVRSDFYANPIVPLAELPGNEPKLTAALMEVMPNGSTPTTAAVQGAIAHLRMRAMADKGRKPVLVLATDGLPQGCNPDNIDDRRRPAGGRLRGPDGGGQRPHLRHRCVQPGNGRAGQTRLMQLASAGGTGMPFLLTPARTSASASSTR